MHGCLFGNFLAILRRLNPGIVFLSLGTLIIAFLIDPGFLGILERKADDFALAHGAQMYVH